MVSGYPAENFENDLPEKVDPWPERQYGEEGRKWFDDFDAENMAYIQEMKRRRAGALSGRPHAHANLAPKNPPEEEVVDPAQTSPKVPSIR
jgi:hypothetical protein